MLIWMRGMQLKLKTSSPLRMVGENNLLPSQTMNSNQNEEALTAVITMNLLSPADNNSASTNFSQI